MLAALTLATSLFSTETPLRPHILLILADDFGFANLGVNRRAGNASPQALAEIMTPNLDALANDGILLNHHMESFMPELARTHREICLNLFGLQQAYKICGPSRASLLSGRLAVHVNNVNKAPTSFNPKDPISGYAGIPRNMTTVTTQHACTYVLYIREHTHMHTHIHTHMHTHLHASSDRF